MIQTIVASADKPDRTSARVTISDRQIEITHLGRGLGSDYLFRLAALREGMEAAALQRALGLTPRESAVLFWIAQGKSNRDASELLKDRKCVVWGKRVSVRVEICGSG